MGRKGEERERKEEKGEEREGEGEKGKEAFLFVVVWFAFSIIHRSGRAVKNGKGLGTLIM